MASKGKELIVPVKVVETALKEGDKITAKATEMVVLLHHAPSCIALIGDMIAISTQAKVPIKPAPVPKHFKPSGTDSEFFLETSLLAVANSGLQAFQLSQESMTKISTFVAGVPKGIKEMTTNLLEGEEEDFEMVQDEAKALAVNSKKATALAKAVYEKFDTITEQSSELMEAITVTRSHVEGDINESQGREKAVQFVQAVFAKRNLTLEADLKENVSQIAKVTEAEGNLDDVAWNDQIVFAGYDRKLFDQLVDLLLSLFADGKADLNKVKGEEGAVFLSAVFDEARKSISVRTTTIKQLFDTAYELLQSLKKNDFGDTSAIYSQAKELKEAAKDFKIEKLPEKDVIPPSSPNRPPITLSPHKALSEAKDILLEGFKVLVEFRNTWRNLVVFFAQLSIQMETVLDSSIKLYSDKAAIVMKMAKKTDPIKTMLITTALQVCRGAFIVTVATTSYIDIYKNILAPNLNLATKLLGVTEKEAVTELRNKLVSDCAKAEPEVAEYTKKASETTRQKYIAFVNMICGK